jgi:hypothetical protein
VLDIVKNLTTELRLASLNTILSTLVEEIYVLHEKETWVEDIRCARQFIQKVCRALLQPRSADKEKKL